jgi:hypothetical protein
MEDDITREPPEDGLIRVTVTAADVAGIPETETGRGSMVIIIGTAADGDRVAFKVAGRFIRIVQVDGQGELDIDPQSILGVE